MIYILLIFLLITLYGTLQYKKISLIACLKIFLIHVLQVFTEFGHLAEIDNQGDFMKSSFRNKIILTAAE
jgi:hypothetical protein